MVDFGGIALNFNALGWLKSAWFYVLLLIGISAVFIGILFVRKKRRLNSLCTVLMPRGNGKLEAVDTTCGMFKEHLKFGGLWDYGPENCYYTKEGKRIQDVADTDFQMKHGKKWLVVVRSPTDEKILVPVEKVKLSDDSKRILLEIAPRDYRNAAVNIFDNTTKELTSNMERITQFVIWGGFFVIALISIMMIIKFGQSQTDKMGEYLLKMGEQLKEIVQVAVSRPGSAP